MCSTRRDAEQRGETTSMFDPTLNGVLAQIDSGRVVLPAMQRPFVWQDERITRLIDSLLRGFPLGTALLWKTGTVQRFRRFQKDVLPNAGITADFESGVSTERYLVLDGQQRLQSLYAAVLGTYAGKRLFLDALSGQRGEKDPGDTYWDARFLTEKEAQALNEWPRTAKKGPADRQYFVRFHDLTRLPPARAGVVATQRAAEIGLDAAQATRLTGAYLQCATALASAGALQVHLIDEYSTEPMPVEEILEVFVRVNSGGLVLQKSDLLMSLLDLKWNDVQPELFRAVQEINESRPFKMSRDDLLKSLLLAAGSETRFDRLVSDRVRVEKLASDMPTLLPPVVTAWKSLTALLMDECKITSERLFRGGRNSLLPFVLYFINNPSPGPAERRRIATAVYMALMSGVFASAEARMGSFARKECGQDKSFPLEKLARLVQQHYGIASLEDLLSRHLDLTLNIAHGGITLDNNPDELQRDHIFPRAGLAALGTAPELTHHYANFHFLRGKDNLNKSDTPPHLWFRKPGERPPYTDDDLKERLLRWDLLEPGAFETMLEERRGKIHERAINLFGMSSEEEFNGLFSRASARGPERPDALVLVENESTVDGRHDHWQDMTGVRYHFPNQYRNKVQEGLPFIYYRGVRRENGGRGPAEYFGFGRVGTVSRDESIPETEPKAKWKWFAEIEDYVELKTPVAARRSDGRSHELIEQNQWSVGVRPLSAGVFTEILAAAGIPGEQAQELLRASIEESDGIGGRREGNVALMKRLISEGRNPEEIEAIFVKRYADAGKTDADWVRARIKAYHSLASEARPTR